MSKQPKMYRNSPMAQPIRNKQKSKRLGLKQQQKKPCECNWGRGDGSLQGNTGAVWRNLAKHRSPIGTCQVCQLKKFWRQKRLDLFGRKKGKRERITRTLRT